MHLGCTRSFPKKMEKKGRNKPSSRSPDITRKAPRAQKKGRYRWGLRKKSTDQGARPAGERNGDSIKRVYGKVKNGERVNKPTYTTCSVFYVTWTNLNCRGGN